MSKENKTVEMKDEELEKVSGDLSISDICPNCQYFSAKDPNGTRHKNNCQKWSEAGNICRIWADVGGTNA